MTSKNKKLIAKTDGRLDVVLSELLEITRSQTQKMIEEDLVLLNDKQPKKTGDKVKEGDTIVILSKASAAAKDLSNSDSSVVPLPQNDSASQLTPEIIAETPDYLVINKPSGLLVHPTQANEKNTLVSFLVKKYPEIKKVGDDPTIRPGIVHRLDKEASGLLVVARTQKMFEHLKEQFKTRTVEKEYSALVHDKVSKDWDIITFPIARSENADRMAARPVRSVIPDQERGSIVDSEGELDSRLRGNDNDSDDLSPAKEAKTEFFVEKRFANCTLLRVILHTGRMHQIRVHMFAYNHSLVGDPLYFPKKQKRNLDEKLSRLFLHSTKLSFTDLNGEKQTFESALPPVLDQFLKQLK